MSDQSEEWVAELWQKVKPAARAQVRVLAGALSELRGGNLTPEVRHEAWWEAHRLAGSLGSYGFADGADAAEELASILDGDSEIDLNQTLRLLVRLNAVVGISTPD